MKRLILDMTRGFRGRIAIITLTGILRVVTGLAFVALSKRAVDIATGSATGSMSACIAALVGALVVELVCSAVYNRSAELSEAAMKNALQERFFNSFLLSEWTGREKFHSGDMLSRLTDDCRVAAECLCRMLPTALTALFQLIGASVFLWYFSPALAIVLSMLLPAFIFAGKVFYKHIRLLTRRIRGLESRLHARMQESLQHRILLLAYSQVLRTIESVETIRLARYDTIRRRVDMSVYSRTAVLAGFESGYLAAFLWGIAGLRNGTVSFGLMTAYLQLAGQIQRPVLELARLFPGIIQSHTAFVRLAEIDKIPSNEHIGECSRNKYAGPAGIAVRNVSFTYADSKQYVFSGFSHIFAPGSRTAIMGATGAGKSTLFRLIMAFLSPQEGAIEIFCGSDSQPVSAATRGGIVYVPQGNSLLSGTIRRNLQLGKSDATEHEMWEALHLAAADFVADLKYGLDTPCGELGHGLSEGQAQRIAIARGLLRPFTILLLDEVSAALDEATETLLMQRLSLACTSHTILIVTHRTGVLPYCDAFLKIDSHPVAGGI